jgi:pyruvate/2-oxoglutarate dehydrogenase complex dihydrolipoamide acyltransferase (E2) component
MRPKITPVNFPKSGMGIEEGTIIRWLKAVGDQVNEGDVLVEIETAKAIQEVQAPESGIMTQILIPGGETVEVNTTLALIEPTHG